jgi:hypothetical protein
MTCHKKNFTPYQREVVAKLSAMLGNTPFRYEKTANNHMQVKIDGIDRVFYTGGTPSDCRSINNFLGDIKAEIKRLSTPDIIPTALPSSRIKADAKKAVCHFVQRQTQLQLKRLRRNLATIRKQEYNMLTELQAQSGQAISNDQLTKVISDFRRQQTAVQLEQAIQRHKGDLFVTPGLIKSAKQELVDFLNNQLPTRADYRDRLQRRLKRGVIQSSIHPKTEQLEKASTDQNSDPSSPANSQEETAMLDSGNTMLDSSKNAKTAKTGKKKTKKKRQNAASCAMPLTNIQPSADNAEIVAEPSKDKSQIQDLVLPMGDVASDRIDSLKALNKAQIRALMAECQAALEQKHQEDIVFLLNEMQARDIDLHELKVALAA